MAYRTRVPALARATLAALLAAAGCECPRGGAHVTVTELEALTPSGRLYGVEELRGGPAPTCADLPQAMEAGAALPGGLLHTQATDRLDTGELFMVSAGDDDWRGCPGGSLTGTFVVWIYDIPLSCDSPACFPAAPVAAACAEGVSIPADSTRELVLPAVPFPYRAATTSDAEYEDLRLGPVGGENARRRRVLGGGDGEGSEARTSCGSGSADRVNP